jgi:hypothetical protein
MSFVVRCKYVSYRPSYHEGIGWLDRESRCTSERSYAKIFDDEAEAWDFARLSGERVPDDCWAEAAA